MILNTFLFLNFIIIVQSNILKSSQQLFEETSNLVCKILNLEIERNKEIRTIALMDIESNFSSSLDQSVLKCLSDNISKVILTPNDDQEINGTLSLPLTSIILYITDELQENDVKYSIINGDIPLLNHMSKFVLVAPEKKIKKFVKIFHDLNILKLLVISMGDHEFEVISTNFFKGDQKYSSKDIHENLDGNY